ncbi:MAG: PHP domain-containing protein [Chloroflexi bacterium]|nr:PHP domain-containing protein [Chloroflexota bacterium]
MEGNTLTGRADLHMHTSASDGITHVEAMLNRAAAHANLDVIAITDHDTLESSLWAYSQRHRYPFDVVPGVEVTSADGHVLGLWVTRPIPRLMPLIETVAAIHEQGGLAVLAHPFEPTIMWHSMWRYLRQPEVLIYSGVDAVEIHNAGAITPGSNWLARRVFGDGMLPVLGNSDAHMPGSIGTGITRFNGRTAADLRASIERGQTAAEGRSWAVTAYLTLLINWTLRRWNGSLATKPHSTRPTHP